MRQLVKVRPTRAQKGKTNKGECRRRERFEHINVGKLKFTAM